MSDTARRRRSIVEAFEGRFGASPSLWARAPGRVDLMGSHTDYNLGHVLTLPIGRDTWIAATPRRDRRVRLFSLNLDAPAEFDLDRIEKGPPGDWGNYVRGVAWALQEEGLETRGFDGLVHSTVPLGSGLSSSAALECAVATLFEGLAGWRLDPVRKARLCQSAENQFVGVSCGILDQYTSSAGRAGCALLLDCRDLSSRPVTLPDTIQVVICDTRSRRELAGSEYGQRRAQCEQGARALGVAALRDATLAQLDAAAGTLSAEVFRRCRFIIEEDDRVHRLARALAAGDRAAVGRLCAASFEGAMTLYEIGAPAMEAMMKAMLGAPGVIGARQAGAGFGGCMVALVEEKDAEAFCSAVAAEYLRRTATEPEVYPVAAAEGAHLIQ